MDGTTLEYETLTRNLDDKNQLEISTYPAGFGKTTFHIPYLYRAMRSHDQIYFQVFIKDKEKYGPNPHIETIHIDTFSYQFPGQEPVELLSNYENNFWMQGNPRYDTENLPPIPFDEHWYLQLRISMTVNGEKYEFDEQVNATTQRQLTPLIIYAL